MVKRHLKSFIAELSGWHFAANKFVPIFNTAESELDALIELIKCNFPLSVYVGIITALVQIFEGVLIVCGHYLTTTY